jgi:hypothetical protein
MKSKVRIVETQRSASLVAVDGSDYDWVLPTDFDAIIDLYPTTTDDRSIRDKTLRVGRSTFDLRKALKNKIITIKGNAGLKVLRIKWASETAFTLDYYSKYMFADLTDDIPTTYTSRPTNDDAVVLCDNDSLQIFLLELLKVIAHQLEGTDSMFDMSHANSELVVLYQAYKGEHPDESIKQTGNYGMLPRFKR